MKISVVIPVFNEEQYISNSLQSLKNQEEKPDEVIVIDNNCTDKTIEIAQRYKVKIVKEKKQGITFARNKGFDIAKNQIIARCDADSILPPNWIKKIKENFKKEKIDGLTGYFKFYDFPLKTTLFAKIYFQFMRTLQKGGDTLIGPNMALTKKIWQQIKKDICLDDKKVHEDIDLALHILKINGKIKVDPTLIAFISARRIKNNPFSFFIEYPIRLIKTLKLHSF